MSPNPEPEKTVSSAPENSTPEDSTEDVLENTTENSTEDSTAEDTGTDTAAKRSNVLPLVLGGLCLVLAVVVGLLGWWAIAGAKTQRDDQAALEAARTRAPLVLSYAPATVDKDIETARAQLSGTFAEQFDQLVNQVVLPATKQQGLSSKTDVTHAALMDSPAEQTDARDVLVFMQQVVGSANQPPQQGVIQVKVTVTKGPDGEWKVSNLQPI